MMIESMEPRAFPIHDEDDLERAHALIDQIWDAKPGSAEFELLDVMSTLVDAYETKRSTLPPGDPIKLLRFKLDELGWSQNELARQLGWSSGRVSEVLNRKRALTLSMVRQLSRVLKIPPGLLVHDIRDDDGAGRWIRLPPHSATIARHAAERMGMELSEFVAETISSSAASLSHSFLVPDETTVVVDSGDFSESSGTSSQYPERPGSSLGPSANYA